ncbi:hypothetical protein ABT160_38675 [Streptomyces sp. NPDC001941]|uniref:hypothetical protein n=1 Tax=Streptomyces sp. NPDC001941 TaxID=3154659 RepID=UPI00332AFD74
MALHRVTLTLVSTSLAGALALGAAGTAAAAVHAQAPAVPAAEAASPAAPYVQLDGAVDRLVRDAEQGADLGAALAAYDRAFAAAQAAPAPDEGLKDKAMAAIKVQVDALVKAVPTGDIAKIAVAAGAATQAIGQLLSVLTLEGTLAALVKPVDFSNLPKTPSLPKLPEFPKLPIPGLG